MPKRKKPTLNRIRIPHMHNSEIRWVINRSNSECVSDTITENTSAYKVCSETKGMNDMNSEVNIIRKEMNDMSSEANALNREIRKLKIDNESKDEQIKYLNKRQSELLNELSKSYNSASKIHEDYIKLKNDIETAGSFEYVRRLERARHEIEELKQQISELTPESTNVANNIATNADASVASAVANIAAANDYAEFSQKLFMYQDDFDKKIVWDN